MSKFIIECPVCHTYNEAKTGFFATKRIRCACGNVINVKTDKLVSRRCAACGNDVIFDQSRGGDATCPICKAPLMTAEGMQKFITFACPTCGCNLQASRAAEQVTCPVCDTEVNVQSQVKLRDQRKDGIPTVIKYEGDNRTLVWKHPITDFVMGSQLIVHETQEAIFLRNGEALDSFPAGRYDLQTGLLPKMENLYRLPIQGQPFHAEVYFVNLTTHMNIKWGTNSPVGLFDPLSGIHVELGAFGSFNLRVTDARLLLNRLVGTTDGLTQDQLFSGDAGYFRTLIMSKVKANLAQVIKQNRINVLELDEHIDQIARHLRAAINENLAEYGMTMPEFIVENIRTPDDDPNFRKLKEQHAERYLRRRQEEIDKEVAEAAFERKVVEAQTDARMKIIAAQGDAEALRAKKQAEADAYRMQAEAEAQEMRMKGYTYQQETQRQVGLAAMEREGGAAGGAIGNISGMASDVIGLGIGLGTVGSVVGMTRDAIGPIAGAVQNAVRPADDSWDCGCGKKGIHGNFCPDCGSKKPADDAWDCECGKKGIHGNFCPDCGSKKPADDAWDCGCGKKGIHGNFCPDCGAKKPSPDTWDCECGKKGIHGNFCPDCGAKKPSPDTWDCGCGKKGIRGKFCPDCGAKKPSSDTWDCECGKKGIRGKFCTECGKGRPEA